MKILLVQPNLNPPGGGNGVAVWMIEALCKLGQVELLCCDPPDWPAIDTYYATNLGARKLTLHLAPVPFGSWLRRVGLSFDHLQLHWTMRSARRICGNYDLVCAANNEFALPVPLAHYIHFPWNSFPRPDVPPGWDRFPYSWILRVYYRVCHQISGFGGVSTLLHNLTLVNSVWTGKQYRRVYGQVGRLEVLFPPALGGVPRDRPWHERRQAFLSVGRLSPEKRWSELVAIFDEVRARGADVGLTLAGSSHFPDERDRIRRLAAERPWLQLRLDVSREELAELMSQHRYGVHAMVDEHYGMAVAELVRAGCLTFVHDSGGAAAIVQDPRLRWSDHNDAVLRIEAVLQSPEWQSELAPATASGKDTDRFQEQLLTLLRDFRSRPK